MKLRETVRTALRSLASNRLRTALTALGMVMGVAAVVTVAGVLVAFLLMALITFYPIIYQLWMAFTNFELRHLRLQFDADHGEFR